MKEAKKWKEVRVSKWEEYPHPPSVFVRVAIKGLTGYGTWKCVRRMEEGLGAETQKRRAEEEKG